MRLIPTKKNFVTLLNIPRALKLIWTAGPVWVTMQTVLLTVRGLLPAALIYLTKVFVDSLVPIIGGKRDSDTIYHLIVIGALFAGAMLLSEILGSLIQMIYAAHAERLSDYIFELIHEKSVRADMAFYEQPEFFDHLHRARTEASQRPAELSGQIGSLLQNTVTVAGMGIILLRYGIWLPVVLVLSALPAFYVILYSTSRMHEWQKGKTSLRRRTAYFDWILTSGDMAAEVRLFGFGPYIRKKFVEARSTLRREEIRLAVRQRTFEFFANLTAMIMTAAVFIWIVWRTAEGNGTLGDLALFYQVFNQGQTLIRSYLSDIGRLYTSGLFLGDLFDYLDLEPTVVAPPTPVPPPAVLTDGIRFESVRFGYGTNKRHVLEDFTMHIPAGRVVAVVGANGAGKSTLVKLLCRFYDPDAGAIKLDGTDLAKFSVDELRGMIAVLFQTPGRYNTTAAENIALGDFSRADEIDRIKIAAEDAGADSTIEKLPRGYDQMLGHAFSDGTELSVGEWQRMALARTFFCSAPIILLDEPTSAMDPWTEADWLKRFLSRTADRTVLIITHRFTTAKMADLIYVMDNGAIIESGSHADLLANDGRYASSWKEQVQNFDANERVKK